MCQVTHLYHLYLSFVLLPNIMMKSKTAPWKGKSEGEVSNDAHDRAEPEITNNTI